MSYEENDIFRLKCRFCAAVIKFGNDVGSLFDRLVKDNSGYIDISELRSTFIGFLPGVSDTEISYLLKCADIVSLYT